VRFPAQVAKPKKRRRKKKYPITFVFLCAILVYFGYTFAVQAFQLRDIAAQERLLNERFQSLSDEVDALKLEIELLGTDEYIEKLARERLGLIRPQDSILLPVYTETGP
jgi:cell division protein FtsB